MVTMMTMVTMLAWSILIGLQILARNVSFPSISALYPTRSKAQA
jgi:hypothetical protein